jgi:hypothetical protein
MLTKGSTRGKDPEGKGSAVYFASQKLVRPPCSLLEGKIFEVPGSWWGSQVTGAARTVMNVVQCMSVNEHWRPGNSFWFIIFLFTPGRPFWFMLFACKCVCNYFLF